MVPAVRAKRSRVAFATAVTVAALPVLVIDNLPAKAEPEAVIETVAFEEPSTTVTIAAPSTTSTTAAPTTTSTTAPPETTTTAAPKPTTTEAPKIQTLRAPAPTEPPTTAAPTTTTTAAPRPPAEGPDPSDPATWDRLARCESGGNWSINSGNGYYGGLQFSLATWQGVGGSGYPHENSREEQIRRGQILQARAGWGQWPHCARTLGWI